MKVTRPMVGAVKTKVSDVKKMIAVARRKLPHLRYITSFVIAYWYRRNRPTKAMTRLAALPLVRIGKLEFSRSSYRWKKTRRPKRRQASRPCRLFVGTPCAFIKLVPPHRGTWTKNKLSAGFGSSLMSHGISIAMPKTDSQTIRQTPRSSLEMVEHHATNKSRRPAGNWFTSVPTVMVIQTVGKRWYRSFNGIKNSQYGGYCCFVVWCTIVLTVSQSPFPVLIKPDKEIVLSLK